MTYKRSSKQRFSIRKFKIGVASALLFSSVVVAGQVAAEQLPETPVTDTSETAVAKEASDIPVDDKGEAQEATSSATLTEGDSKETEEPLDSSEERSTAEKTASEAASEEIAAPTPVDTVPTQITRFRSIGTGAQTTRTRAAAEAVSVVPSQDGLTLSYDQTKPLPVDSQLLFAVWTENKGQDDLVWYEADRHKKVQVPFNHHKEYGRYHIHTYANTRGGMTGLDARTFDLLPPKVGVEVIRETADRYQLVISGVDQTLSSILVPIWSETSGQDDINWYQAQKRQDGRYHVTLEAKSIKMILAPTMPMFMVIVWLLVG